MACLNFFNEYKQPFIKPDDMPTGLITLNTLKMASLERISVLNFLEKVSKEYSPQLASWRKAILEEFSSKFPKYFLLCTEMGSSFKVLKARYYDRVTYFVLAHAVVNRKSYELTDWFVRNEIRLFSIQFFGLTLDSQREYLRENNLAIEPVEKDFKANTDIKEVYKVPWTYVLDLVERREVSLKNGTAYIDGSHLHLVAASRQRRLLKSFLSSVRVSLPTATLDVRFRELIEDLGKHCQKMVDNPLRCLDLDEEETELDSLPDLSHSFPPCMHRIYHHMDQTKHLRYHARMQYISFLMEIGLSVTDTISYFQNTFMQTMSEKAYKQGKYDYSIRYQFGLAGRMIRQRCSDCKVLQRVQGQHAGDCHGCPLTSHEAVKTTLNLPTYGDISERGKREILSLSYSDQPSKICAAIFAAKHDIKTGENNNLVLPQLIVNPVQYYALSRLRERDVEEEFD